MAATSLKPHDVVVVCQLALWSRSSWTYEKLGQKLRLSASEICNVLKRCKRAKLVARTDGEIKVDRALLADFIVHGVPTAFFAHKTEVVKGVVTAMHAPAFQERFATDRDIPVVWPYTKGKDMGEGLLPLLPAAALVAPQDETLYTLLSAIDILRIGRQREKDAAESTITGIIGENSST